METNEAPEKLYILFGLPYTLDYTKLSKRRNDDEVEYTRTDVFIGKVEKFLKSHCRRETPDGTGYICKIVDDEMIEDFKNYIKGE